MSKSETTSKLDVPNAVKLHTCKSGESYRLDFVKYYLIITQQSEQQQLDGKSLTQQGWTQLSGHASRQVVDVKFHRVGISLLHDEGSELKIRSATNTPTLLTHKLTRSG